MNELSNNSAVCRAGCLVTAEHAVIPQCMPCPRLLKSLADSLSATCSRPIVMGVLGSVALLGQPAFGQDTITAPAPPAAANQPSAALDFQPETLLNDFRLGPFDIQPRITTGVTYDDNILISSQNPESDLIWSVQPAFLAIAGDRLAIEEYQQTYHNVVSFSPDTFIITEPEAWPGKTLMVDYGPKFNWFTEYTANDSIDEFLTVNALWPTRNMILGVRQDYVLENTTIIEAGRRSWEQRIPTDLMAGYQLSERTTAEVNLNRTSVSYEQGSGLADYTDWNWNNWFNYQYSPRLNLGLGANLGALDLTSQPGQTCETPEVRARYRYGARVLLDTSFGIQLRQYGGGVPSTTEPVFSLVAHYETSENSSFHLAAFRRELPSVSSGYDYISTGVCLGFQQQFGDRYFASLEMTYYYSDYLTTSSDMLPTQQADRVDNFIEVRPAIEARFSHHLVGSLFYLFRTDRSAQWPGWTDNQVGTRFTWTF